MSIGYYKPASQAVAGSWVAMAYVATAKSKEKRETLGMADDFQEKDGDKVLSWEQAQVKARLWFKAIQDEMVMAAGGEVAHVGPYRVNHAWNDYLEHARGRGVKGVKIMSQCYEARVKPVLGEVEVCKLTKKQIEKWMVAQAASPRIIHKKPILESKTSTRRMAKAKKEPQAAKPPRAAQNPADQERARKDSTNRVLSNLKACLNYAMDENKVHCLAPWREVKRFPGTTSTRVRTLNPEEKKKLVAACDPELRILVIAALHTGGRYGELSKVRVKDFLGRALHIEFGKGKGHTVPRDVLLTSEASSWFCKLVDGRPREDLLFKRSGVIRTKRKEALQDWDGWAEGDQGDPMDQAVIKAGIDRVRFHELRHTYASALINAGISLKYIAEQLGHKDTRMVERHYGHLAKSDMHAAIEKLSPTLGLEG